MNVVSAAQIRAMLGFKSGAAVSNLLQGYSGKRNKNVHMRIETNKKPAHSKWLLKMMGNVSSVCFADPDPLETVPTFTVAWYSLPLTRVPNPPRICFPTITLDPGECIVLRTASAFIFSRAFIVFMALLFSHCSKSTLRVFSHLTFICSGPCYSTLVVTVIHVPVSSVWFRTSKIPIKLKSVMKKHSSCFF